MLESSYDVVVVGAGPGGSATAKRCAELGLSVAMLEKRQEIGAPKRCGEGLSASSVQILGQKIPKYCTMQTINGAFVLSPSGKRVVIDYGKTQGYILERKQYDKWLAEEAARAGARVQAKTEVTGLLKDNKGFVSGVTANFEGDVMEISSTIVVAADGVESKIARMAGMNTVNSLSTIDSGFQFEMVGIDIEDPHKLEIYLGNKISPRGYVWMFPKSDDKANVGIGIGGNANVGTAYRLLSDFIKKSPSLKKGSITEVNAGGIPVGGFLDNMVADGLVVVGDAAHQVNPIHGGGMKEAAIAGRIAAEVISDCMKNSDVSAKALSKYNSKWWEERGKYLKNVEKLREVIERLDDQDMDMLAEMVSGEDLVELTRGKRLSKLGKMMMKNPQLIKLAKRLLS